MKEISEWLTAGYWRQVRFSYDPKRKEFGCTLYDSDERGDIATAESRSFPTMEAALEDSLVYLGAHGRK